MAPDYDLSTLPTEHVDLWIFLQADVICGQIMADQAERLGYPLAQGDSITCAMTRMPQTFFKNG